MGIKYLWPILSPFCERKPLYELQYKRVAVDLSCWVCESQNIAEYTVQPRMYLRLCICQPASTLPYISLTITGISIFGHVICY
jgi:hypothetical protein